MNNTIKLSLLAASLFGATTIWAAATDLGDPSNNTKTLVTSGNAGTCPVLVEDISVKQSKNVGAAYDCTPTHVGIGTANSKGRGSSYQIHSGGGNPLETTGVGAGTGGKFSNFADAQAKAALAATAALTKAGTST